MSCLKMQNFKVILKKQLFFLRDHETGNTIRDRNLKPHTFVRSTIVICAEIVFPFLHPSGFSKKNIKMSHVFPLIFSLKKIHSKQEKVADLIFFFKTKYSLISTYRNDERVEVNLSDIKIKKKLKFLTKKKTILLKNMKKNYFFKKSEGL